METHPALGSLVCLFVVENVSFTSFSVSFMLKSSLCFRAVRSCPPARLPPLSRFPPHPYKGGSCALAHPGISVQTLVHIQKLKLPPTSPGPHPRYGSTPRPLRSDPRAITRHARVVQNEEEAN
ncbi:hypothetical protein K505DRAFT_76359 [Melanomma pulvis-pyrius CBS 109.77]|uniref:Uncharacterized protein n=1 Tax=Melanomma pulvis-pyrius CBS 109.77 TaxID=1314802 RepID=A0A6A6X2Z9_9PLEO|nr:hypothetical protein K505DRAFT_76359 [Melanomma pulvis-pyrius CBS 109.77]